MVSPPPDCAETWPGRCPWTSLKDALDNRPDCRLAGSISRRKRASPGMPIARIGSISACWGGADQIRGGATAAPRTKERAGRMPHPAARVRVHRGCLRQACSPRSVCGKARTIRRIGNSARRADAPDPSASRAASDGASRGADTCGLRSAAQIRTGSLGTSTSHVRRPHSRRCSATVSVFRCPAAATLCHSVFVASKCGTCNFVRHIRCKGCV